MFRAGKVLKVKVELSADVVGFGRATILDSDGGRLFLQLRTSKGEKRSLPKGTRVWFVSDSPDNPFNGLWSTTIVSTRMLRGKTALECTRPKFEALVQRRRQRRIACTIPVSIAGEMEKYQAATRNLSRSGAGIEVYEDCADEFGSGHYIDLTIEAASGAVEARARVIQARFNWLANRTDVGLEFVEMNDQAKELLERLLLSLGGQARFAPEGKDRVGSPAGKLSTWLKTSKDNVDFIKGIETHRADVLSQEDIEELHADDGEDDEDADDEFAEEHA